MKKLVIIFLSIGFYFGTSLSMQGNGFLFENDQQQKTIVSCDGYKFVEFIQNAMGSMQEPSMVTTVRECGFYSAHVPYLLLWSCQLFDRFSTRAYCQETQDLEDILKLILVVDMRAQVDAYCIKNMRIAQSFSVDSQFIQEHTQHAHLAASYLKLKLAKLWGTTLQEAYAQKTMPSYKAILGKVKALSQQWDNAKLMPPVWVCCVRTQSGMLLSNWAAGWPGDKFGNWWNPDPKLVEHCLNYGDYADDRALKTKQVIAALEAHQSWAQYFGNTLDLGHGGEEYDSDGGF